MLLIVECLKWVMHVRHENQCVSEIGLLYASFVASTEVDSLCSGLNMQHVEIFEISFFLKFLLDQGPFCGVTGTLCFILQMTLPMGFKAGWIHHHLHSFVTCMHQTQIAHL